MSKKIVLSIFIMTILSGLVHAEPIVTDSTSRSTVDSNSTTTVKSPPPSAISPSITTINNDICVVGTSGAVQTQIFGISGGTTTRDYNCERLKLSKTLFDMGMKVASVSLMCQDGRVFNAMNNAGTPCPVDGKIGNEAKTIWDNNPKRKPEGTENESTKETNALRTIGFGVLGVGAAALLLGL
jgi:hypothetical protein